MPSKQKSRPLNVLLVGCGKMGTALLQGWLEHNIVDSATIVDPSDLPSTFHENTNITHHKKSKALIDTGPYLFDAAIIAVKPQVIDKVCADVQPALMPKQLIVSIAAGTPIKTFEKHFGKNAPVVRTMPNTPAAIGKGVTAAMGNAAVNNIQKQIVDQILSTSGIVEWVETENFFHAITALSGSGPAYVFLLIETLTDAGVNLGLPADLAETLARQTVIGSAALAEAETNTQSAQLRRNVTSPGGTTEAALSLLMDGRLEAIFKEALSEAQKRSKELAKTAKNA